MLKYANIIQFIAEKDITMLRKTISLSKELAQQVTLLSRKEDRDFSSSLRYALRIGLLAIENPDLTAEEIKDILEARAELEAGMVEELDLENL
jgi:hypothetical protein